MFFNYLEKNQDLVFRS